jgi:hypothetical protein
MTNKNGILTVQQQRDRNTRRLMINIGLEAHLQLLIQEILAGDTSKLMQFQQDVQYAPIELKTRLLHNIHQTKVNNDS